MASLKRGLVDTVKKAAEKVRKQGVQVAAKAGTRGARAIVETTAAAVKTVDKLQSKLGRGPRKVSTSAQMPMARDSASETGSRKSPSRVPSDTASAKPRRGSTGRGATEKAPQAPIARPRRASAGSSSEAQPMAMRETGRKTMHSEATVAKRSKAAKPQQKQFKVKRGQKHLHSGR